jgi:hypothetical protein
MINSASSQPGSPSSVVPPGPTQTPGVVRRESVPTDNLSTSASEFLRTKLASEPEVRPDVVARGEKLASDSSYPSTEILSAVARKILQSPDPSEDLS